MLAQALGRGRGDISDRRGVAEAGDTHDEVGRSDLCDRARELLVEYHVIVRHASLHVSSRTLPVVTPSYRRARCARPDRSALSRIALRAIRLRRCRHLYDDRELCDPPAI